MSIRQSVLALLAEQDRYGYGLRQEFETRTGGIWPINIGQVYTTIGRLQRDGLVEEAGRQQDGSVIYRLTGPGRAEAERWWHTPVDRATPSREELAIKLALAVATPGVDLARVIQGQRTETVRALQSFVRAKRQVSGDDQAALARTLVLDSLIFAAEAEVRWLDHSESTLTEHVRRQVAHRLAPPSRSHGGDDGKADPGERTRDRDQ